MIKRRGRKKDSLASLGKYEEALQACEQAIKLDPMYFIAWYDKGWVLGHLDRREEALQMCEQAIKLGPKNIPAWNNKAWNLEKIGLKKDAEIAFAKAKELDYNL
jgi:tetratricopeptide (TPR) repeat protein